MKNKIRNLIHNLENIKIENKEADIEEKIKKILSKENPTLEELMELHKYEKKINKNNLYKKEEINPILKKENKNFPNKLTDNYQKKKSKESKKSLHTSEKNKKWLYKIEISEDKMEAYISFFNITENSSINYDSIIDFLKRNSIVKGIQDSYINTLIQKIKEGKDIHKHLIAKGRKPEKGKDGYIKYYLKNNEELSKKYKENISSGKKIWNLIINKVKKGEILAEKIYPSKGKDGYTVTGIRIPGLSGEEISLRIIRNVRYSEGKYIADIDGEAIIENLTIRVKRFIEGHFKIKIDDDKMKVKLDIFPSIGGANPVNLKDIKNELNKKGIKISINEKLIQEKIKEAENNHKAIYDIIIGEGELPINGRDGFIKYIKKPGTGKNFKILPDGRVDYKERDIITTIKKDDLIAIIFNPEKGKKDGKNVFGETIKAKDGKKITLKYGKNVKSKKFNDRIEIYSEIDGHLKVDDNMIYVLPVYIHEGNIDLSIGNINFPGDVIIKGDVLDDFKVKAEGDIFIYGNVGAANIISERSIIIRKGIMGKNKGKIFAGGSIAVKFIENGYIEAEGNIIVEKAIINSYVLSNSIVSVVIDKGQIIGGHISAGRRIEAKVIGSPSGIKTTISVGYNFLLKNELKKLKEEKEKYSKNLDKINEILDKLFKEEPDIKNFNDDMKKVYVESLRKKTIIISELNKISEEEKLLNYDNIIISEKPEIVVYDYIYPDVTINFLNNTFVTRDKNVHIKIKFDYEKNIIFDMLM